MDSRNPDSVDTDLSDGSRAVWWGLSIFFMSLAVSGCVVDVENYATEAKGDAALHELKHHGGRDGWYFYTSLLNDDSVYIELKHLSEDAIYTDDNHIVSIRLRSFDSDRIEVLPASFSVEVFDLDGNEIEQVAPPHRTLVSEMLLDETSQRSGQYWHFSFTFPETLPDTVIERVRFYLKADGELKSYDYSFPVTKKKEYTYNPRLPM